MKTKLITIILLSLGLFFLIVIPAIAEEVEEPPIPPSMPGRVEETGTLFEITDSEYLNISLESTEEIKVALESAPKTISLHIGTSSVSASTVLTFSNLEPNTTYYKFTDSYKNKVVLTADSNGSYTFTQDLTQNHHIWFQPGDNGTVYLPTDCTDYGTWDEPTSTCTLTLDIFENVEIVEDNITLDCNNHEITTLYPGYGYGIYLSSRTGLTIKNCTVTDFYTGIFLAYSSDNAIIDNSFTGNRYPIWVLSSYPQFSGNQLQNNGLDGIILSDMELTRDYTLAGAPVFLNYDYPYDSIIVPQGYTLTIEPGTIIKAVYGTSGFKIEGTLIAEGTETQPIVFTTLHDDYYGGDTNNNGDATQGHAGFWGQIVFTSTSVNSSLDHIIARYGGRRWATAPIHSIEDYVLKVEGSDLTLANSMIEDNTFGVRLANSSSQVTNTTFKDHRYTKPFWWYYSTGLNLAASTAQVRGSTFQNNRRGIFAEGGQSVIEDNVFTANTYPIWVYNSYPRFAGNQIADNDWDGVVLKGMILNQDYTLGGGPVFVNYESIPSWGIVVPEGYTLTIEPGTIIKFVGRAALTVHGTLIANGTTGSPIIFTSLYDDEYGGDTNGDGGATSPQVGSWGQIVFNPTSTNSSLDNIIIRYGGKKWATAPIHSIEDYVLEITDSDLTLSNSIIENNVFGFYMENSNSPITRTTFKDHQYTKPFWWYDSTGLKLVSSNPTIDYSIFLNNKRGIDVVSGSAIIRNSSIYDNSNYGIYNSGPDTVDAVQNWWGDPTGPYHPSLNPDGLGNRVSDRVDFEPWLDYDPTEVIPEVEIPHNSAPSSVWIAPTEEPVNPVFGNYLRQERDLSIPGRGLPLVFERTYNSLSDEDGPLGHKWTHSYNIYLRIFPQAVIFVDADGRQDLFTLNPDGAYTPQKSVYNQLVRNPDDTFTLTKKNQTKFNFSPEGRLVSIVDRNNNQTTFIYNPDNQLIQVIDSTGRSLGFTLDEEGRIIKLTDPKNQDYLYEYDADNNLISYTDPTGAKTQYTYDQNHNLVSIIDTNNHVLVTNTYDEEGRVISQLDAKNNQSTFQYDPEQKLTIFIDALSNQTKYYYDEDFRVVKQIDAQNNETLYTFDENNNRTSITDANNHTTNFTHDENGNLASLTDPLDNTLTFTYDSKNNLLSSTNAKGDTTFFEYDLNSNLVKITDPHNNQTLFTYDQYGQLIEKEDTKGNRTEYQYDQYGNLKTIIDALNNQTSFNYDILSRLISITDAQNNTAYSEYDEVGRLVKTVDPLNNQTFFEYDGVGNLIKIIDAKGNITHYFYDEKNNLEKVKDSLENITQYQYDALDNRIKVIDANNHQTVYTYDSLNRLIQTIDALGKTTEYSYDSVGNVISFTNGENETIVYQYDANNRLIKKIFPNGEETIFEYDENGNIIQAQNVNIAYTYDYDKLNRLISFNDSRFGSVNYSYDELGNRLSLTDPQNLTTSYQYDPLNRLTQITDPQNQDYEFEYDSLSRRIELALPNGLTTNYNYDSADRLLSLITKNPKDKAISQYIYTYDEIGNRLSKQEKKKIINYQYDVLSRLLEASKSKIKKKGKQKSKLLENYIYDPVGNRLKGPKKEAYQYNLANELLNVKDVNFQYDLNGNLIKKEKTEEEDDDEKKITNYQYDPENRLIQVIIQEYEEEELEEQKTVTYLYDPFGRRIGKRIEEMGEDDDDEEGENDDEDEKKSTAEQYLYDNEDILAIYDAKGRKVSSFIHGPGVDEPLSIVQKRKTYYYLYDGLGSVVGLTNKKGKIVQRYGYDSFGRIKWKLGKVKQPYTYTGREYDKETGLYYYRARYYDPEVGRFVSRDSFVGLQESTQNLNLYGYVRNSPTNFVDPSGNILQIAGGIIGGGITGAIISGGGEFLGQIALNISLGKSPFILDWTSIGLSTAAGTINGAVAGGLISSGVGAVIALPTIGFTGVATGIGKEVIQTKIVGEEINRTKIFKGALFGFMRVAGEGHRWYTKFILNLMIPFLRDSFEGIKERGFVPEARALITVKDLIK